jgi:hypothetical protein
MRNGHELYKSRPADDGVVSAVEACHLEPQELGSVVLQSPKGDEHVDVPKWVLPYLVRQLSVFRVRPHTQGYPLRFFWVGQ